MRKVLSFSEPVALDHAMRRQRCTEAVTHAKEFLLNSPQKVDTEYLKCLMEVHTQHAHEPIILLRAKVFERLVQSRTIFIDSNPVVGTVSGFPAGVGVYPEYDAEWILKEMRNAMMSHLGEIDISDESRTLMIEAGEYFKTRSATYRARALAKSLMDFDPEPGIKAGVFTDGTCFTVGAGNVGYACFIDKGLNAIMDETRQRLAALPVTAENTSKINFYQAALISMGAVVHLAQRYADLADSMAQQESDPCRKAELLEIAAVCRHVPAHPPRTLRESLQSWWFLHLGIQMEQPGCGSSPGRIGQYLDPYYQRDKVENGLTSEDAVAWLKCIFVRILEYGYYQGLAYARLVSGHTGHTISVGGLTVDGNDATTELDYLMLDTQIALRNIQPTITVLYHDNLKEDFLMKAVELERTGLGQPQWLNNRAVVQRLLARHSPCGITLQDARNCTNFSCVSTGVAGKTAFIRDISAFNLAKMVEFVMTRGLDSNTGKQIGLVTAAPETFVSFDDFFEAYASQVEYMFKTLRAYGAISNMATGETVPCAFRSAMTGGCLESGKNIYEGGATYYLHYSISTAGVDAANALAAVKQLVYDEKKLSMRQLQEALAANFEGYEDMQDLCLKANKHGNGDPAMDAMVRRVYQSAMERYQKHDESRFFGRQHMSNIEAYSLSMHNYFGMLTGALPNGRAKGLPLTDGSVSASPGTDKNGPLALVSSAARALDTESYGSNHFNMKFHPSAIAGAAGARKLISLIKTYMDMGGSHIQFNIVSSDTLRDAQATPQDYKALTVRVAGFSAYFTRLHQGVQNELIARTELTL